ncbi:MAG: response regulator transcription factor [Deltaproteobacteria bacterium]|nr:response regulator transcription factor [Deltaproteobacteria bacterium]
MDDDSIRAIIVEGDDNFRRAFLALLTQRFPFVKFQEEKNGDAVLTKIQGFLPHILFMELKLPGAKGLELTSRIRHLYPDLVIVIVTGLDLPEYRDAAYERGANFFISKNTSSAKDLLNTIELILEGLETSGPSY